MVRNQCFLFKPSTLWYLYYAIFPGGSRGKEPACQCGRPMRRGFHRWVGKTPWRKMWQPPPVSCLEDPRDRGACQTTVHGAAKSPPEWESFSSERALTATTYEMAMVPQHQAPQSPLTLCLPQLHQGCEYCEGKDVLSWSLLILPLTVAFDLNTYVSADI